MAANIVTLTDANFAAEVTNTKGLVMVDFWATWCGPCRAVAPVVERLAAEFDGQIKIAKLDVDANPAAAQAFGIRSIPTFIFFRDGQPVHMEVGGRSEAAFRSLLGRVVQFNGDSAQIRAAEQGGLGAA